MGNAKQQRETTKARAEMFRKLPAIDELLRSVEFAEPIARDGRAAVTDAARAVLESLRREIAIGRLDEAGLSLREIARATDRQLQAELSYSLRPVINATGVVLHTNLGRAPLAPAALEHIAQTAGVYSNLEFDLAGGERGKRDVHADRLFAKLLQVGQPPAAGSPQAGATAPDEIATIVVNNNAAAVLLGLNTLGEGGEVIVSRGELVEIGGSFRIPDVMAKSGATLREVGTTNRTRLADYERAIGERTRLLLRVHRSNFQIVGFTEQPSLEELVALGRARNLPVMEDLGSGALFDLGSVGVAGEPDVAHSLRAGVDVVTYSGDKLLGGPQAGMLSGPREVIARIRRNPLFRALRVDKLTYAALEATLLAYIRQEHDAIPALRMMRLRVEELAARAAALCDKLPAAVAAELIDGESVIGGGSAPGATLPTKLIAARVDGLRADEFANRLRTGTPPVVARVEEDRVLLDLRTVFPEQDEPLARALARVAAAE